MKRNFIIFINPISGTKSKSHLLALIKTCFTQKAQPYKILETRADADYGFLKPLIATENITDVVICGGDGTVNQICAHLVAVAVQVGIIPLGSGNGLAFSAGIPKNTEAALQFLFTATAQPTDAFYINGHFSCMLCGLGFDAAVAHQFAQQKKRGLLSYAKLSIQQFAKAKTFSFVLHIKDRQINTNAFFISIANSNQFGNHITIAPKARLNDGLLDIVVVNKMSKLKLIFSLLYQVIFGVVQEPLARHYRSNQIAYYQTDSLTIANPQLAPLHIDGEPMNTAPTLKIKILKSAFKLLRA